MGANSAPVMLAISGSQRREPCRALAWPQVSPEGEQAECVSERRVFAAVGPGHNTRQPRPLLPSITPIQTTRSARLTPIPLALTAVE